MDKNTSQDNKNSQGVDAGERVVSSIRTGMKREFAMMMKAQSEMGGFSVGQKRVTRSQNPATSSKDKVGSSGKVGKKVESSSKRTKEEIRKLDDGAEGGLVEVGIEQDGEERSGGGGMADKEGTVQPVRREFQSVELKKVPTKLRDLLNTGLLEGLTVHYIRGSKARGRQESQFPGVIRGTGILCYCDECKGDKVITPNQFEVHAGSGNKRPPEYIYLENGKSLRDVLNACKVEHLESVEMAIKNAIGRADSTETALCLNCKGLIPDTGDTESGLCDSCVLLKESVPSPTHISDTDIRAPLAAGPSASVASSSQSEVPRRARMSSKSQPQTKTQKRLTRKDLGMHKIVFADNVLPEGTDLAYVVQGEKRLEGYKENGGIFCFCCKKVVSPSQFEAHAGFASRRKPYDNIYTSDGVSLHEIALQLSALRKASSKENDELCSICEDGGDLLFCDNCPRAFHPECVPLSSIPQERWHCKYCQNMFQKAKLAKINANAIAAGRVAGINPLEEIAQRCIRTVGTLETDIGGCVLCRRHDFSVSEFNDSTVIICDQCEKEYHVGCLREQKIDDLKEVPANEWFCCTQCSNINCTLQKLIVDGEQMLPQPALDIVKKKCEGKGLENDPNLDIRWRLLSGKTASEENRVWLSGAVTIFHDRFDPIVDSSTRRDLIPDLVYGRQFNDQDLGGMYCAILIVNSEVVSAGIFRVFGQEVAELPLVATSSSFQGKGYFQSLFYCIEKLLESLNVKDLVLPAADEAESLWKDKFGFENLSEEEIDKYTMNNQLMIFQGNAVLHKFITPSVS